MAASICNVLEYTGATGSPTTTDSSAGITIGKDDLVNATTPTVVPPSAAGTNYSWYKTLVLNVVTISSPAEAISGRKIALNSALPTGLYLFFKAVASYAQATSGNKPADSGSNGATPAGYTLMTTTPQLYDNTSQSSGATGPNGMFVQLVLGVDNTYIGGGAGLQSIAVPGSLISRDEV